MLHSPERKAALQAERFALRYKDNAESSVTMSIKVAFAVNPDGSVLEHFGFAEQFAIYEFGESHPVASEVRHSSAFCRRPDKELNLQTVADLLADCQAVICAVIGPCARQELAAADVEAFEFDGTVESAIQTIARQPFLVRRAQ
jgi:nitrogen fixation protein NifB